MFSGGALIVVAVVLLALLGVAVGLKTRAGSEIGEHPSDGSPHAGEAAAPQASGSSELAPREAGGSDPFDSHGTG
jgi:ABC-type phosphate transport system substrate-binding protein